MGERWMLLFFLFLISDRDRRYVMLLKNYVYIYNIYKLKIITIMQ